MRKPKAQILLIDIDPDSVSLLEEAFREAEERSYEFGWAPQTSLVAADDVAEGVGFLRAARFDVILYGLSQRKADHLGGYLQLRTAAPEIPVVALVGEKEEILALTLIRHGAQDYLIRSEIDCVPLMRAIRCAMERAQLQEARESGVLVDDLTGLYNQRGFQPLANRYAMLASRHGFGLVSLEVELPSEQSGQDSDMRTLELAEALRTVFGPEDLLARTGTRRFACLSLTSQETQHGEILSQLQSCLPDGAILNDVSDALLCDNKAV